MRQKTLFDDRKVPAIWQGGGGIDAVNPKAQAQVWTDGVRFGCNAIDTAERYGNGLSERIVGEVLKKVNREDVFIATKVAPENLTGPELIHACKQSLKRLGTDYIDLYQIHWNSPDIPLEWTLDTMMELRDEGKIRYIGVCNFTLPQIDLCNTLLNGELATVQMEYNLTNRLCERDVLPYCEENNILFLGYSPFNGGKLNYINDILKKLAHKYKRTTGQITLNWLTSPFNNCVLPKTTTMTHLIENAQSTEFELDEEDENLIAQTFQQIIVKLKPSMISCDRSTSGIEGDVPAYKTIEEAMVNKYNHMPSPLEISKEITLTKVLSKPIFVRRHGDGYDLVSGNVRYWAWVIAFGMDAELECIII